MTNRRGTLSAELAQPLSELAARGDPVFTTDQFAKVAGRSGPAASRVLSSLVAGGWIVRLVKGKYLIVPLEAGPRSTWSEDPLLIASHLAEPAAVAYWSACHYWNMTEQVPRTVFVQTTQKKMRTVGAVLGVRYRFVRVRPGRFFGTARRSAGRGQAIVTDREKTIIDALDRPDLCGGIRQVAAMLAAAEEVDWDRADAYLQRMGVGAVYKRLGFLAEALGRRLALPGRSRRLARWRSRLTGGYAPLEPGGGATRSRDARWRVRVNVDGPLPGARP